MCKISKSTDDEKLSFEEITAAKSSTFFYGGSSWGTVLNDL